jgi:hypothetical protein
MKILNKIEFLALPEGVLYSEYSPCCFRDIFIKGDTWGNDYLYIDLVGNVKADSSEDEIEILDNELINGGHVNLDFETFSRDGSFDDDQLYAVYEKKDISELINKLFEIDKTYPLIINQKE